MSSLGIPPSKRALVMGILNITPDSFSDGGNFLELEKAVAHGMQLVAQGADILDIGGESTRPGARPVEVQEELRRILPVIKALRKRTEVMLSIDTSKAVVAEAALAAGATIINDVSALEDPAMGPLAARTGARLILMHKQGTPQTMQIAPAYPNDDIVAAVLSFLAEVRAKALQCGVSEQSIILDPGLGFGKTMAHNFSLLKALPQLVQLGSPILIGHSRKSFLGGEVTDRLIPSIAITTLARYHGVLLFRVHDPRPHQEALHTVENFLFTNESLPPLLRPLDLRA
ncbi:MAG: dihydropteroate synthase [Chthoniobacterales bacterium]|nr:dihydropteroate synthase [Chthoniobacterales bacterium]